MQRKLEDENRQHDASSAEIAKLKDEIAELQRKLEDEKRQNDASSAEIARLLIEGLRRFRRAAHGASGREP